MGRSVGVGCSDLMVTVFRAVRLGTKLITVDCLILIKTFHQQFIRNAVRAAAKSWAEVQCQLTSECGEISEIRTLNICNIYAESPCQHKYQFDCYEYLLNIKLCVSEWVSPRRVIGHIVKCK